MSNLANLDHTPIGFMISDLVHHIYLVVMCDSPKPHRPRKVNLASQRSDWLHTDFMLSWNTVHGDFAFYGNQVDIN
jgi:hypothetical protein